MLTRKFSCAIRYQCLCVQAMTLPLQLKYPNTRSLSTLACVSVSDLLLTISTLDAPLFECHAVITSKVAFAISKPLFHFLDNSSGPTFECLSNVNTLALHFSIASSTSSPSSRYAIATFTEPIKHLQNVFSCSVEDNLLNSHSTSPHCTTQESISRCFIAAIFCLVTPISKD